MASGKFKLSPDDGRHQLSGILLIGGTQGVFQLDTSKNSNGSREHDLIAQPGDPMIEYFRLEDVNGYKTIELTCEASAKIVSAENGSGKTTLLNALYGILAGKPAQLQKINFGRVVIKIRGHEELAVYKGEISALSANILNDIRVRHEPLLRYSRDEDSLLDALTKFALGEREEFFSSNWFNEFYLSSPFDRDDIESMCDDVIQGHSSQENRVSEIKDYVEKGLNGVAVLYLPTYRRIEAEMPGGFRKFDMRPGGMPVPLPRYRNRFLSSSWKSDQLIYFGLEDVEQRLDSIAESIKNGTFDAYTRIGGRTLEQLIEGGGLDADADKIDLADLRIVLSRLGKASGDVEKRISGLFGSGEITQQKNSYLRGFLAQLLEVYASGKDQERAIESFVGVINSYWLDDFDEKEFVFDKMTVSTSVKNRYTRNSLPLNALSSGEKQIVSVFARLYLNDDSRFIVLIDEPELSLSMDWQKRFLTDILKSPSCTQMVAITHSPFVFENELDPYAGPLKITNRNTSLVK